jgi:hypothetical protein
MRMPHAAKASHSTLALVFLAGCGGEVTARLAGHGPLFAGLSKRIDLKLVGRLEFRSGAVAMRYEPRR